MSRTFLQATGLFLGAALLSLPMGCSGDDGASGSSSGTLMGTITNSANANAPIEGATVATNPDAGVTITTGADGTFSADLPIGVYQLAITASGFEPTSSNVSIIANGEETQDFVLDPISNVMITFEGAPDHPTYGEVFTLTATATPLDGSTVQGYQWTQTHSAPADIQDPNTPTPTITLGDQAAYKQALIDELTILPDRFRVLGIDPWAFEHGGLVTFQCEVTTDTGAYTEEIDVHVALDFATWATGLRNVPIGQPMMLTGGEQDNFDWAMTSMPEGSTAVLADALTRHPFFTPDLAGTYEITVTDNTGDTPVVQTLEIFAGEWQGAIGGMDDETGYPTMHQECALCHDGDFKFDEWSATGHAHILTNNINYSGHYGEYCFPCHTVGYQSGGIDSASDYQDFIDTVFPGGHIHADPHNWENMLADQPESARLANIQCENCHGPNGTGSAHRADEEARISVASEVCGTCHGEPPRHGRYQQWQQSGHGNHDLAIEEGERGSCNKCHTAQGFINWSRLDTPFAVETLPGDLPNLAPGEAEPITCVACHEPHNVGTQSGDSNDIPMRWDHPDSPELLGGFTAYNIGKGSTCIICHNTRRGEAEAVVEDTPDQAPHGGAQGDVLMGENAFFVQTGVRGPHSLIKDTCSNCHLQKQDPPADLSYYLSGTNHTFAATKEVCADCHSGWDPDSLIEAADSALHRFGDTLADAIEAEMRWHTESSRIVYLQHLVGYDAEGEAIREQYIVNATTIDDIESIELVSYHGRQAMNVTIAGMEEPLMNIRMQTDTGLAEDQGGVILPLEGGLLENEVFDDLGPFLSTLGWNYWLLEHDGSHGMHNPGWFQEIVSESTNLAAEIVEIRTGPEEF